MTHARPAWDAVFDGPSQRSFEYDAAEKQADRRPEDQTHGKRQDIQGLRMVAVVAVVLNHLTGRPVGGFVGVDVFFVISGFLMTTILVRELGRPGRSSGGYLGWFYLRRARRLLPAALVVTGLVLLSAHFVFNHARYTNTATDGLWATIFLANWHFLNVGTDYFGASEPPSPFQHYWSLSVEEQFYFGLPIVLLLAAGGAVALTRSRDDQAVVVRLRAAFAVSAVAVGASLWWAIGQSSTHPLAAYFSTFTRVWELALGGVAAVLIKYVRFGVRGATTLSWAGVVVIAISLFTVNSSGFPFPGAIYPCLGSMFVILAASPDARPLNFLLTNRLSTFVGDISYSVYLVHFPVIIILGSWMNESRGAYFYTAVGFLTLGLPIALYALVERPVLNSRLLLPRAERAKPRELAGIRALHALLVATAVMVVGVAAVALWPGRGVQQSARLDQVKAALEAPGAGGSAAAAGEQAGPAQRALTAALHRALLATSWPKLTPPLDRPELGIADRAGCTAKLNTRANCTWGSKKAAHTMYLVGDSTSAFYDNGFIRLISSVPDWNVRPAGAPGCSFADPVLRVDKGNVYVKACPARNRALVNEIKASRPDLLVVTDGNGTDDTNTKVANEIAKVRRYVKKIVILPAPPLTIDPQKCYTKGSVPSDCVASLPDYYEPWLSAEQYSLAPEFNAAYIDPTNWFSYKGECPMFVDHTPMKHDAFHITQQYAGYIAPVILEAFRHAKLLP